MKHWKLLVAVILLGGGAAAGLYSYVSAPRLTPELRGYDVAERLGCHGCHGPRGTGGMDNPMSNEKEIPAWDGGMAMMYVNDESEIREWILDGYPRRLAQEHQSHAEAGSGQHRSLPIRMPAYRGVIDDDDLADLIAYYKAVSAWDSPPENVRGGYAVAARAGCFGCHGPGGMLGVQNPRSFKGYIPPWRGRDFSELVRSDDELRSWIREGTISRLESNRMAAFFIRRQVVHMPAYGEVLTDQEVNDVMAYINWLSAGQDNP